MARWRARTTDQFEYESHASVVAAIDELVARYAGRESVPAAEVVDVLLDLRILALADAILADH
jgi:hypothetical protein